MIEDYDEIADEPMEFGLFCDLLEIAKNAVEGKLRAFPPDCELDLEFFSEEEPLPDTPINQCKAAVIAECLRRFPEDRRFLMARRFLTRYFAISRTAKMGDTG